MTPEQKEARKAEILKNINRLGAVLHTRGKDVADVLQKLADTAEKNPNKIFNALRFL